MQISICAIEPASLELFPYINPKTLKHYLYSSMIPQFLKCISPRKQYKAHFRFSNTTFSAKVSVKLAQNLPTHVAKSLQRYNRELMQTTAPRLPDGSMDR